MSIIQEYISVSEEIKKLEDIKKSLSAQIIALPERKWEEGGYVIQKIKKNVVSLKPEVSDEFIKEKFPEVVETKIIINTKKLQKNPDAHDYLELHSSEYLMMKVNDDF